MKHLTIAGAVATTALLLAHPASAAGSWSEEHFPQLQDDGVLHTAAVGDDAAWAFGITNDADHQHHSLAFRRGQQGWEQVPTPDIGRINAASVVSRDDVWAVGDGTSMHWNGAEWREVPIVAQPEYSTSLSGVTAFGAEEVWNTGFGWRSDNRQTRSSVQHWDGRAWHEIALPDLGIRSELIGISGTSPNDVWVAGAKPTDLGPDGKLGGLLLHWDGERWDEQPLVEIPGMHVQLRDVHALAPDDVWAVGYQHPGNIDRRPVAAHWDGTRWSLAPVPDELGQLNDVVQVGDELRAVGYSVEKSPYVLRYDGTSWQKVPAPAPSEGKYLNTYAGAVLDGRLLIVGVEADVDDPTSTRPYAATHGD
ncbi:hypothetical protein SAMN05421805_108109 [Saccharopolyspora antimicrobica]|uniref:Uncharacterized protein n=1 Tax=Saccharopolyspora antimicrobica TaxID=455193 RepID=A0A1I5DEP0_9PSEU|nr:hypothetical protein [Saccharopolyspora antimicrobica]RKT85145.1 hypothetical protein ATL45_3481 [Saccharopolyspora antimicrobica]SFN97643.1 hypothetical protein SAMN05421805_108109 [Saccharopolyspora antimicrobica]